MEGGQRGALKRRSGPELKKKGANKKGKWSNFSHEYHENIQLPNPSDTVYLILCSSRKIGGVIGKGGGIIKALRDETRAKITVSDSFAGSDERVIMIYSSPDKSSKKESEGNEESMAPHCAAQDAFMKVHDRIIKEDLQGGEEDDKDNPVVTTRLLVPNNMVGCLLGKGGDVIKRLRSETGASIRVLPAEHLPTCALSTDELVQIEGKPVVLKKALYEVSTLLHQNPRKEKALNFAMPSRGPGFHPSGAPISNMPPAPNPMWSPRNHSPHMARPPWMEDYGSHPGFMPGGFDDGRTRPVAEASGEFSMKILCPASKIGGVIGKGGVNVRQLQQETGTSIHVEDASSQSEERVVRVSAFETLRDPRSQTIDATLLLQNKASELSEKGIITTRLLVPSNKVGCLLGQGGTVINEMRRRTHADIRVYSKDEKPKCASEDEELVQISGSIAVAKDALAEIASRLRARCLRDASTGAEPTLPRPAQGYGLSGSFPREPPIPGPVGIGSSGGYNLVKGGAHEFEPPSYAVQPGASRYSNPAMGSAPGAAGSIYATTPEAPGSRMKPHDPYPGGPESKIDLRGGSDHVNAAPSLQRNFSGQNHPHHGSYMNPNGHGSYPGMAPQQAPCQSPYPNPHQIPYQHNSAQQSLSPYQNTNVQGPHSGYPSVTAYGSYQY